MEYESRLNQHGATEQRCGTAGDGSDEGSTSLNYRVTIMHICWCSDTPFTRFGAAALIRRGGRDFSASRVHRVLRLNCQGNQQNGDKPQNPSKDSEHFAQIKPHNWLNCRLQLAPHTGRHPQNHFMSGHSLEMCQSKTDFLKTSSKEYANKSNLRCSSQHAENVGMENRLFPSQTFLLTSR